MTIPSQMSLYFLLSLPSSRPVFFVSKYDSIEQITNILETDRQTAIDRERETEKMSEPSIKSQKLELFHVQFRFMDSHKCIISRIKLQIQESKCVFVCFVCTLILSFFAFALHVYFVAILSILLTLLSLEQNDITLYIFSATFHPTPSSTTERKRERVFCIDFLYTLNFENKVWPEGIGSATEEQPTGNRNK